MKRRVADLETFNSLSRDHIEGDDVQLQEEDAVYVLSTPSLGITLLQQQKTNEYGPQPLSTPSLGIT